MDVTQLEVGSEARILEIRGGQAVQRKLSDIGIVPGRTIVKTAKTLLKGPIVVTIGTSQVAIGFGMAKKIIVEPLTAGPL